MSSDPAQHSAHPTGMTATGRYLVLCVAFLGWMFAGMQMSIMSLATGPAMTDFAQKGYFSESPSDSQARRIPDKEELAVLREKKLPAWFSYYNSAFLFGAATGGLVFGWLGDRAGRKTALGLSILCYSLLTLVAYYVRSPEELLVLRFLAAMGVGGMWPSGVALASEAWSDVSRPALAGLIGTSANVGLILMSVIAYYVPIKADDWRWVMFVGAAPAPLGIFALCCVPESPRWLREHGQRKETGTRVGPWQVFQPPLLKFTLIGIGLGTVPLFGGWGVSGWVVPWSDAELGATSTQGRILQRALLNIEQSLASEQTYEQNRSELAAHAEALRAAAQDLAQPTKHRQLRAAAPDLLAASQQLAEAKDYAQAKVALGALKASEKQMAGDPKAKAFTSIMRSTGGTIGSLLGGWLAHYFGRRAFYFFLSLASLVFSQWFFRAMSPHDDNFTNWVFAFGFVTSFYFGWLPLCLPELFPTHARATGAGVSFNFGRIATAFGVLGTGKLVEFFNEQYDKAGVYTSLIYAVGMVLILVAPKTEKLKD